MNIVGKTPLSLNVPVPIKKKLQQIAKAEGKTMTDLIIQWVEEYPDKNIEEEQK